MNIVTASCSKSSVFKTSYIHYNAEPAFSNSSGLKSVAPFSVRISVDSRPNAEIKLRQRFRIRPV